LSGPTCVGLTSNQGMLCYPVEELLYSADDIRSVRSDSRS